jgi:hypothetical protein
MAYVVASSGCCHCKACWSLAAVPHGTRGVVFTVREMREDGYEYHVIAEGFATKALAEAAFKAAFKEASS